MRAAYLLSCTEQHVVYWERTWEFAKTYYLNGKNAAEVLRVYRRNHGAYAKARLL